MDPIHTRAEYRRLLAKIGKDVIIRRYAGTGPARAVSFSATARARVSAYDATELIGTVVQGDRRVIVLAEDLEAASFPMPILTSDKCVIDGRECAILSPDPQSRQLASVIVAWELQVRG